MAAPHRFDALYREVVELRDGSEVVVRTIRPDDKPLFVEGFERLSPASRYRRFLTDKARLTDADLAYLTEVDGERHFALGASRIRPGGQEEGIGVARFVGLGDSTVAEPAVVVVDEAQGLGLGTALLARLAEAARERGVERFQCLLLADNDAIKHLLEHLSEDVVFREAGDGTIEAEVVLAPEAPNVWRGLLRLAGERALQMVLPDPTER